MTKTAPLIDIREDHWDIVQGILQKHVPQYEVWAFGSRAKWTAKQYSDLDLAIITDKPLSLDVSASLSDDFSESDLPYKVDIVDWATTSESFRKIIEWDKVVVQRGNAGLGVANSWHVLQLGKICSKIGSGATPRGGKDAYRGGDTALIRSQNIYNDRFNRDGLAYINASQAHELRNVIVEENDVLLNITGDSVARCCLVDSGVLPARVNQHVAIIRTQQNVLNSRFLRYVLVSPLMQDHLLALASAGATRNALTKAMIESLDIQAPCIEEQRAIAYILGTLDDKIELNRKQNETLEAMARALFKAWFVDFEPVRAKMEGRWQRGQSLPGLPAHLYDLFPDRLVDSELGEIPEGWRVFAFGDVAQQGKGAVSPGNSPQDAFTHYSLPAFDSAQTPVIELGTAIKSNKTPVPDGAVLVSKLNPHIPRIWQVGKAGANAVCSTEFTVWTPKAPANSAFLYCLASSSEFNSAMRQLVTGTSNSHQRVKPEQLRDIRVFAASENVIEALSDAVRLSMEQVLRNRQQSHTLAQLRDTLLPKLISGELRVSDTESFLKERKL